MIAILPSVPKHVLGLVGVPNTIVAVTGSDNVALNKLEVQPALVMEIFVYAPLPKLGITIFPVPSLVNDTVVAAAPSLL